MSAIITFEPMFPLTSPPFCNVKKNVLIVVREGVQALLC